MYTKEETDYVINKYLEAEDKTEVIEILAEELNKPIKSIIGKLSKERVYVKKTYKSKNGNDPVTKRELIDKICNLINADAERLQGMIKTPKPELVYLLEILTKN